MSLVSSAVCIFSTGVDIIRKVGALCFEVPKRTLKFCFHVQKEILLLPIRCINRLYKLLCNLKSSRNRSVGDNSTAPVKANDVPTTASSNSEVHNSLMFLTGGNAGSKEVASGAKTLRKASLQMISNFHLRRRKEVENSKMDREKEIEEMYRILPQEKELIKVIAAALRYLKSLHNKRENLSKSLAENARRLFSASSMAKDFLKHKASIESALLETEISTDLSTLLRNAKEIEENIQRFLKHDTFIAGHLRKGYEQNVLNNSIEILQSVVGVISEENVLLRRKLEDTNEKLEELVISSNGLTAEIIKLSDYFNKMCSVNKQMVDLQNQLDKARKLLRDVQSDRDELNDKLVTLATMIKEEEDYLKIGPSESYESGFEDYSYYTSIPSSPFNQDKVFS